MVEATGLVRLGGHPERAASTVRTDRWWIAPAITIAVLGGFVVYATWAALQGNHYFHHPYLSPFYSPVLWTVSSVPGSAPPWHAVFGELPGWWPGFLPYSPALFILVFPGAFRFTCYYYRKAYYRAFGGSPLGCAVVPLGKDVRPYRGETAWLLFQNLHRYALYFALLYLPILGADAVAAYVRDGQVGIGVGSVVLTINVLLLGGYTLGCHSFRHLVGGRIDCLSCGKATVRLRWWRFSSLLNVRHGLFAWISLFWVAFSDLYVRLVSMGVIRDLNTWS
jgi:hypothetical protein